MTYDDGTREKQTSFVVRMRCRRHTYNLGRFLRPPFENTRARATATNQYLSARFLCVCHDAVARVKPSSTFTRRARSSPRPPPPGSPTRRTSDGRRARVRENLVDDGFLFSRVLAGDIYGYLPIRVCKTFCTLCTCASVCVRVCVVRLRLRARALAPCSRGVF